jgi:ABC-type branched-subunit amino acid transport system substrate-binding protein
MKRFTSFVLMCVIVALISLFAGCAEYGRNLQMANLLNTPEFYHTAYKVGLICALSGPHAPIGSKQAEEIAVFAERVNSSGGIFGHKLYILGPYEGRPLPHEYRKNKRATFYLMNPDGQIASANLAGQYLVFSDALAYDSRGERAWAVECMQKLIKKDVLVILGPTLNSTATELATLAEKAEMPVISFGAHRGITAPSTRWTFAATPFDAVSTIFEALRAVGPDREKIRSYLETHLTPGAR